MTTTSPVSALPTQLHIEPAEFTEGIKAFQRAWSELEEGEGTGWRDVRVVEDSYGPPLLRIPRLLDSPDSDAAVAGHANAFSGEIESEEVAADSEDDEALVRSPPPESSGQKTSVVYDIVYSLSYRVPVLYISLLPGTSTDIHDLLVPTSHKAQIQHAGAGPLGALSLTDHPLTSLPAYFIHPCRTAEGMAAVTTCESRGDRIGAMGYLMRWLGLVGPSVGLTVPVRLAKALSRRK
ncbi:hypothetical protein LTS10_005958 [Elasticomyces elasticus]|nr:hypothetical protein LTS10_005958 [Elasticomyces elasticus]